MLRTIFILLGFLLFIAICVLLYMLLNNKKVDVDAIWDKCRSSINPSPQNNQTKQNSLSNEELQIELKQLTREIGDLKQKISQIETRRNQDVKTINDSFSLINKKIASIASKNPVVEKQSLDTKGSEVIKKVNTEKYPRIMYAHYADSENPIGFSHSLMKDSLEGCFFKITIKSPTQASFSLIENEDIMINAVQALATIVNPCCSYEITEPITNRYKTIVEGSLIKVNNLWQVESKSKISFL